MTTACGFMSTMNKCIAFAAGMALASAAAEATPVEWDFVATGCTSGGCVSNQHYPVTLAALTLPSHDSYGTAKFGGFGAGSVYPAAYTGDRFALKWSNWPELSPSFTQNDEPFGECEHRGEMCKFDLSWSEQNDQLDELRLYVGGIEDTLVVWLGGATVASDGVYLSGSFAGCGESLCQIEGSMIDPLAVNEPGRLALMLLALAALIGLARHLMPRKPTIDAMPSTIE